jgi:hypothetical protein
MKKQKTAVTVDEIQSVTAKVTALHEAMDFAAPIEPSERSTIKAIRIGTKKLRIVQNRLEA